ncbi:MAG: glycerol-3-phosphate 1-O-acyltransferase PlsY [Acidobacteriota bacterium]
MTILLVMVGYLTGSVPCAWLLGRRRGTPDLRTVGSGNVGATNLLRVSGSRAAALAVALDVAKGAVPVALARGAGATVAVASAVGVAAILGHVYPCWLAFRGGKGVATTCGAFGVLAPVATLAAFAVFAVTVLATRYVSAGSVLAVLALGPLAAVTGSPGSTVVAGLMATGLVVFRHRANLVRLAAGTERRLGGPTGNG